MSVNCPNAAPQLASLGKEVVVGVDDQEGGFVLQVGVSGVHRFRVECGAGDSRPYKTLAYADCEVGQ